MAGQAGVGLEVEEGVELVFHLNQLQSLLEVWWAGLGVAGEPQD